MQQMSLLLLSEQHPLVHSLDTLLCRAAEPLQIYKSNKLDLYTQDEIKFAIDLK
jgi:hypothetical protein